MPHNLSTDPITGQIAMMYTNETPWHRLGKQLDNPLDSAAAIRAAKLDWLVKKYPLQVQMPNGYQTIKDQYVIMRTDVWNQGLSNSYFGIVGKEYRPLQNYEAFAFFDDIVGEKEAIYETAGALGNGERIWILAKLPGTIRVVGDDICNKYLLLSNCHDGKSSVQIKFTPIRVVCQNTLTLALNQGPSIRVAHTSNIRDRMQQAEVLLGIIRNQFGEIETDFQKMASVKMDSKKIDAYYRILFPDPKDQKDQKGLEQAQLERKIAENYFSKGQGNQVKGTAGTLWAAFNGITEMVDYHDSKQKPEQRLNSIWFGSGYLLKARAFKVAMDNIKTWVG